MLIALAILVGVFGLQRMGSRIIGWIAGPIMVLWFLTIAGLGIYQIILNPQFTCMNYQEFGRLGYFMLFCGSLGQAHKPKVGRLFFLRNSVHQGLLPMWLVASTLQLGSQGLFTKSKPLGAPFGRRRSTTSSSWGNFGASGPFGPSQGLCCASPGRKHFTRTWGILEQVRIKWVPLQGLETFWLLVGFLL